MLAPQSTLDDVHLMKALGDGHLEALQTIYDRYGALAFSLAFRMVGDRESAEEVVQEAFLGIWHYADRYDAERCPLRPWLSRIVRQRSIDHLRSRNTRPSAATPLKADHPASTDVWSEVAEELLREQVQSALSGLPQDQRVPIELAYFGGWTHAEIAQHLNIPLGTVKGRLRLGLKKLQLLLTPSLL